MKRIALLILLIPMMVIGQDKIGNDIIKASGSLSINNDVFYYGTKCHDSVCHICGQPITVYENKDTSLLYLDTYTSDYEFPKLSTVNDDPYIAYGNKFDYTDYDICSKCKQQFQKKFNTALENFYHIVRNVKKDKREKNEKAIQEKEKQELRDKIKELQNQLNNKEKEIEK